MFGIVSIPRVATCWCIVMMILGDRNLPVLMPFTHDASTRRRVRVVNRNLPVVMHWYMTCRGSSTANCPIHFLSPQLNISTFSLPCGASFFLKSFITMLMITSMLVESQLIEHKFSRIVRRKLRSHPCRKGWPLSFLKISAG
jgi:hypothetical protein